MRFAAFLVVLAVFILPATALAQELVEKPDPVKARVEELVKKLGSEDFEERESATEELKKIGEPAAEALRKAAEGEDAEASWRAKDILKAIEKPKPAAEKKLGKQSGESARREAGGIREKLEEMLRRREKETEKEPESNLPDGLGKQFRKEIERMLKKLEEMEKGLDSPGPFGEDSELIPDEIRKMFEEMRKRSDEARRRFDEEDKPVEPKTEPRGEGEAKKRGSTVIELGKGQVIIKKLTWKDGKLVEEENFGENSKLPGLRITDTGSALDALRYHLSLGEKEGVLVAGVVEDCPFAKAGVKMHDIITKVDDKQVGSLEELTKAVTGKKKIKMEIMRQGERKVLDVELNGDK